MSKWMSWAIAGLMTLSTASVALAVQVDNRDDRMHTIHIRSVDRERTIDVDVDSFTEVICANQCVFSAPGLGEVRATRTDRVIVEGGKLRLERRAQRAAYRAY